MELQDLPRAIVGDIFHRFRQDGTFHVKIYGVRYFGIELGQAACFLWGELGNQNIPGNYYPYLSPIITEESYPIGASNTPVMGLWQNKIGNPDIKWETIRMLNFGVDLSF